MMSIGFTIIKSTSKTQHLSAQKQLRYTTSEKPFSWSFYYNTNTKFSNDKIFEENKQYIFGIDGPVLNLQSLKKEYAESSWSKLYLNLYQKHQQSLPTRLKGDYCGFIFEKETERLFVFNNPGGSRRMYYTALDDQVIIASSLQQVTDQLDANEAKIELNRFAAYSMLTFGAMPGNQTYVKGVFRLHAGESILTREKQFSVQQYVDYNDVSFSKKSEITLIDEFDERFVSSLREEMDKDLEYDYEHLATLSGGMDSRMSVMLAHKMGYKIKPFCFSQSGYHDEIIARDIAKSMGEELAFIPLDKARHLFNFDENLEAYDGLSFYLSSAHFAWGLQQLNTSNTGMIHTGMIGDGVMGSGLTSASVNPPRPENKLISNRLYHRIESEMTAFAKHYTNEETFFLYNRAFNLAISGTYICASHGYHSTPFMDPDLIKLMLSVPPEMKYFHKVYIHWVNRHHPEVANFKWERTRMKPTAHWKTLFSRYTNKIEHLTRNYLRQSHKLNMAPYPLWYKQYPEIKSFLDQLYESKKHFLERDKELAEDVKLLFENGNVPEKSMALTLLGAIEKFKITI